MEQPGKRERERLFTVRGSYRQLLTLLHWVATGHFTGLKSTADRTTRVATQPSRATGLALLHHIGPESWELAARGAFSLSWLSVECGW